MPAADVSTINLDTHVLVFAIIGEPTPRERRLLESNSWGISAIVLWELAMLVERRRIRVDLNDPSIVRLLSSLNVWPLDLAVCVQSTKLDFDSDPADMLIAATSVVHGIPLLTRDEKIRRSRMVPLA